MRGVFIVALLVSSLAGCAALSANKRYGAGEKAEQNGDLGTAIREYQAAAEIAPANPKFSQALSRAKKKSLDNETNAARQAESAGDWAGAAQHWKAASAIQPGKDLEARAELARLKTDRVDPLELYQATKKLSEALPGDAEAQKALDQARADAVRYYSKLAETMFDGGSFQDAYQSYENARKVKPDDEIFKGLKYRIARAKSFEADGDARLKSGDALAAYRAYEEAQKSADLPGLGAKLDRAKRGAGSLIEQLEQAKAAERLQKWEDAAELYTVIRDRSDAPKDVAESALKTRKESAKIRADRAVAFAGKNDADKASAALALAVEHTDAPAPTMSLLRAGLEAVEAGQIGVALQKFQAAKTASPELPLHAAAVEVAKVKARSEFESAKVQAVSDPAEAMVRVQRLSVLKDQIPGYDAIRGQLVKRAFTVLMDRAEMYARDGKGPQAAELFKTALDIAKVPADLKEPLDRGADRLKAGDFAEADAAFKKAAGADAKSRLAKTGLMIAGALRLTELKRQAAAAKEADDPLRAAAAYREILTFLPDDQATKDALEELRPELIEGSMSTARAQKTAGRPGGAYVYVRRVLELEPNHPEANDLITSLAGSFDLREAPLGWVSPVHRGGQLGDACPGAERDIRDRTALYLTRTRNLGADYLQPDGVKDVDAKKRPAPPVEMLSALESCAVNRMGGSVAMTMQIRLAGQVLAEEQIAVRFDPATLPKDEAKDGIDDAKVMDATLKEVARQLALAVQKHAAKLKDWRSQEARARIKANDEEAVAQSYAVLTMKGEKLTPAEKETLRELERFVLAKFK
ncbi:MAG: hypothetical protein U1E65_22410 [Myxococcota bacterium]